MPANPKIAMLHYAAPPTIGGVEAVIADHARLAASHGYAPRIIAGRAQPFDPRIEVRIDPLFDSRAEAVATVNGELAHGTLSAAFSPLKDQIKAALEQALDGCKMCIAHNVVTLHKNLPLTAALRELVDAGRVRLIAWCHDFAWSDPIYQPELHDGYPWNLLREAWPGVRYVVVSEARRKVWAELSGMPLENIRAIHSGIDPIAFLGIGADAARWREQFHWGAAEPLMLLPARVTRRKNIELGIRITAALRARGLSPQLVVMGPLGPHNPANAAYLQELKTLSEQHGIGQSISFLQEHGTVSDAARRDLFLLADLLLFPSAQEGFGIPILEGGTARLPVFCSDIPPFRETAGERAHYFALDEPPERIAERIHATLFADHAYQLRARVLRDFDWERIWSARLEPLLHEVLA